MNRIIILQEFEKMFPMTKVFDIGGNDMYIYDAKSNLLANITFDEIYQILKYYSEENSSSHNSPSYISDLIDKGIFLPGPLKQIVPEDDEIINMIEDDFENYIPRTLMIEVTERCNLACRYCFFSKEDGFKDRQHSFIKIDKLVAFKAIDIYYKRYIGHLSKYANDKRKLIIKRTPPSLQWWGGEPFLAFDIIVQTKEYFESLDWEKYGISKKELIYGLSSNLTVFNSEILKFLFENKIRLKVSIDGNEDSHDKNRVFLNGEGTFKIVIKNIMKIIEDYPTYAKSYVGIQAVLADNVNKEKSIEFINNLFKLNSPGKKILTCSFFPQRKTGVFISDLEKNTDSIEENVYKFKKNMDKISSKSYEELSVLFNDNISLFANLKTIICIEDYLTLDDPSGSDFLSRSFSCPLGVDTMFVSATGHMYCCCKTDYSFPIGHIETGISISELKDVYSLYYDKVRSQCNSCWAHNFCTICPALVGANGNFNLPIKTECSYIKKSVLIRLIKYVILKNEYNHLYSNKIGRASCRERV